jgi:methionyl-tRNA synthetase
MKKNFYITTTLPYVNADPHIGFALEIVQADVIARSHALCGEEVFFNTGTDEHGLKIYRKALEEGKPPQKYVDEWAAKFDRLKKLLNLSYNNFIRTTDKDHVGAAKEFWKRCAKKGDIYKDKQKIKYCVGCELEKTDSELTDGKCPVHPNRELETFEEENYFFRFSKYQKELLALYEKSPEFVVPKSRLKEIKNFVAGGLKDFSVSRLKEKMPWGVAVPNDSKHVMYVWFDALVNYIAAVGWPRNAKKFKKWWPVVQIAGKDNLRQQSAMWQAMLMSAGLPTSKQILIHGFITSEGQKMSKSLGNVVSPFELVKKYGVDPVRYYLLREIPSFSDGDFSYRRFEQLYNADLANGLGNLVQRVAKLCENANFSFQKSPHSPNYQEENKSQKIENYLKKYQFDQALFWCWKKIKRRDEEINERAPWKKQGKDLEIDLAYLADGLLEIAHDLKPFLPDTAKKIGKIFEAEKIKAPKTPLFPRL